MSKSKEKIMEASDVIPAEPDAVDPTYVPRYLLKDENGRKFQSEDPSEGVLVADLRPE